MIQFYKIEDSKAITGSGTAIPEGFTEYTNDKIPSKLQEALEVEIVANKLAVKITEYKAYLEATDFKVLPDYDEDVTEVKLKRQEAREFIRANETKE